MKNFSSYIMWYLIIRKEAITGNVVLKKKMSHRGGGLIEAARICNSPGGSSAAIIHQECAPGERKQQFVPFLLLFSLFDHRSFEIIVARSSEDSKRSDSGGGCSEKDPGCCSSL